MRGLAAFLVLAVLATGAAAAMIGAGERADAEATALAGAGSFAIANSREGEAVFGAGGIAPGQSASGTVEIANTGSEPGWLVLAQEGVADSPGLGGGLLSRQLTLTVADITGPGQPLAIYNGPLAPMAPQQAGQLEPGERRSFEFVATLPAGAGDPNAVQGASTSVGYSWTATETVAEPEGGPPSVPSPASRSPEANPSPPVAVPASPLELDLTRIRRGLRHGRLLVWARCDRACSISLRGSLRARTAAGHRRATIALPRRPRPAAGIQRLAVPLPHGFRHWLRAHPGVTRLRARIVLRASDGTGARATTQRALRLRRPR